MFIIALTGGIGSGKSTAAKYFSDLGIAVIDADEISREIVAPKTIALQKIIKYFGESILNSHGELQRDKLREIIFHDAKARAWLENLLHPLILQEMFSQAKQASSPYCILVIPLLFEKNLQNRVHRVVTIDSSETLQIERIAQRDKMSFDEIDAILKTQLTRKQRLAKSDDIVENNGNLSDLKRQITALHEKYLLLVHSSINT